MNIRTRIFLVFVLALVIGFTLLGRWINDEVKAFHNQSYEEVLVDTANVFAELVEMDLREGNQMLERFQAAFKQAKERKISAQIYDVQKQNFDLRVYVTDAKGLVIFDSHNPEAVGEDYSSWRDVRLTLQGKYGARTTDEIIEESDSLLGDKKTVSVSYVAAPVMSDGVIVGVISVGKPKTNIYKFVDSARKDVMVAIVLSVLFALLIALLLYLWISKPLQSLVIYAQRVTRGERAEPPLNGGQEISDVARAMVEMRTALEDKQYVEHYVQTLTHEIKSPLTAIMTSAELLGGELPEEKRHQFSNNIMIETERLTDFSNRLLQLAAVEKLEQLVEPDEVDVSQLLSDVTSSLRPLMQKKQLVLDFKRDQNIKTIIAGDKFLLKQALENLLCNAIDFSPVPGHISIHIDDSAGENHEFFEIQIFNQGEGIPDYALPHIFERFYSLPRPSDYGSGKKSTGLGLNFVKEVAELHGGAISLENAPTGGVKATLHIKHMISTY